MNNADPIDRLARVQRVEPPPFLYTRIQAKLATAARDRVPRGWVAVVIPLGLLLLMLNLGALRTGLGDRAPDDGAVIAGGMGIGTDQQFYP